MGEKMKYELKEGSERNKNKQSEPETPIFKTEEMLKQEAHERLAEQNRLDALKPPPSVRRSKFDNYMYHYKWHTIISIIGAILIVFLVRDTLFRPKPDLTLVIAASRYLMQTETDALQAALGKYVGDINGDGRILVNIDSIHLPIASILEDAGGGINSFGGEDGSDGSGGDNAQQNETESFDAASISDPEMIQASMMKLMAIIAAGTDTLFLLDDDLYVYITGMAGPPIEDEDISNGNGADVQSGVSNPTPEETDALSDYALFESLVDIPGASGILRDRLAIKDTLLMDEPDFDYLGELAFSLRPPLNAKKDNIEYHALCIELLKSIDVIK